jgi:hypothetical protein
VSDNRPEAYEDEAALYEAAAARATDPAVRARLAEWARLTREIAARERELFFPDETTTAASSAPAPTAPARGAVGALEEAGR